MRVVAALLLLVASSAGAQIVSPLNPPTIDTSALATKAEMQAAIPSKCTSIPPKDTLTGSVGTGEACIPALDRTALLDVQSGNTTLAANCTFTITFARTFTSPVPFIYAAVVDASGNQMPCKMQTRTSGGGTGICSPSQSALLNLSAVTAGFTFNPFATTCTAGTAVMFVGREPTQ